MHVILLYDEFGVFRRIFNRKPDHVYCEYCDKVLSAFSTEFKFLAVYVRPDRHVDIISASHNVYKLITAVTVARTRIGYRHKVTLPNRRNTSTG